LERFTRQPLHPHNTHPNAGPLTHCHCSGNMPSSFFYVATTLVLPLWNVVWLWPVETVPHVNTNIPKKRERTSDGGAPTEGRAGVTTPPPPPSPSCCATLRRPSQRRRGDSQAEQSSAMERNRRFDTAHASYHYHYIHFGTNGWVVLRQCNWSFKASRRINNFILPGDDVSFDFKTIRYETCSKVQCDQRIQNPWYGVSVGSLGNQS